MTHPGSGHDVGRGVWGRVPKIGVAAVVVVGIVVGLLVTGGSPGHSRERPLHPARPPNIAPGSASQIARLVQQSHMISRLPRRTIPTLTAAPQDDAELYEPGTQPNCTTATSCVFGDRAAHRVVVLLGDSHARMWVPALGPVMVHMKFRLILLWYPSCPVANVSIWCFKVNGPYVACDEFRTGALALVRRLDPWLVLTGDSASRKLTARRQSTHVTDAQWRAGTKNTLAVLKATSKQVAVIGDLTAFSVSPPQCLAAFPTAVQTCSVPNPNPAVPTYRLDEMGAARAEHVAYLDPLPWLCTTTCSPVVGNKIVYSDTDHVAFSYAEYLATVMGEAVRPLLAEAPSK